MKRLFSFPVPVQNTYPNIGEVPVFTDAPVDRGYTCCYPLTIQLSQLNERVLLHEVLHALLILDPHRTVPPDGDKNEDLVQFLTEGLLLAGDRRTEDRFDLPEPESVS